MARFVMANRRARRSRDRQLASRRILDDARQSIPRTVNVVSDNEPRDLLARRIIVFDADPEEADALRNKFEPDDVIVEPEILHRRLPQCPIDLSGVLVGHSVPVTGSSGSSPSYAGTPGGQLTVNVRGSGKPLQHASVVLYARSGRHFQGFATQTDKDGDADIGLPVSFVPSTLVVSPYAGFWSRIVRAPDLGKLDLDLTPLPDAPRHWWHSLIGVSTKGAGAGVRVGVIDTGLGPHPALAHATSVGAIIDAKDHSDCLDVDCHGTHVAGAIAARPTAAQHCTGVAPDADLVVVRVFQKGRDANQADVASAIQRLSQDQGSILST